MASGRVKLCAITVLKKQLLHDVLEQLPAGVILFEPVTDEGGTITDFCFVYLNRLAQDIAGADNLIRERLLEQFPSEAMQTVFKQYKNAFESGKALKFEAHFGTDSTRTGRERIFELQAKPLGEYLLVGLADITHSRRLKEEISRLATHDELTGLYNRRYLIGQMLELLSLARRNDWWMSLLYFDLNHFKPVNDNYGHGAGDAVLRDVARRLEPLSREEDILARWGGDEFVLLLPGTPEKGALKVAKRIAEAFAQPFYFMGGRAEVGASIGGASMPAREAELSELVLRADEAMYIAKLRKDEERAPVEMWKAIL